MVVKLEARREENLKRLVRWALCTPLLLFKFTFGFSEFHISYYFLFFSCDLTNPNHYLLKGDILAKRGELQKVSFS